MLAARRLRLLEANLYLVIGPVEGRDLFATVEAAIEGGVDIVQLRAKDAPDDWLIEAGAYLARKCHEHAVLFFINDRPDLVEPIGADGVHVGQDDTSVAEARRIAGPAALVGVSTHAPEQLAQAASDGADYAAVGPVNATPTKPGRPATGYRYVWHAQQNAELPWFAIGGIDDDTIDRTLASGAERIVVVRAIAEADDPLAATKRLKEAIADRPGRLTSEERNAAVRSELRPFAPGERPAPAALAAIFIAAIGLVNLVLLAFGYQPRNSLRTSEVQVGQGIFGVAMLVLATQVWRLKAWALLLTQALLAISSIFAFASVILAQTFLNAVGPLIFMAIAAPLFWTLVRVLARAQAPRDAEPPASARDDT
ncbi:MAG: thiamine phosphate synthase [Solirubrobacteraceae bacterium]|nr:thiamine phosphate synthase [Solirubrobacteraceae bacterium]